MHLVSIHIHPIKSVRALDLDEAMVYPRGLEGDRRWMVTDVDGLFRTQRQLPALATIRVQTEKDGSLTLEADGMPSLSILPPEGPPRPVTIWKDATRAIPAEERAHKWLSEVLESDVQLMYQSDDCHRRIDPAFASDGEEVSFADGYPVLLTTTASLDDLNKRLDEPVPMTRFRPNLVVHSDSPWDEDAWKRVRVGSMEFRVAKPCGRCVVTTIDQKTGTSTGKEPLRTLSDFRLKDGKALFGMNLIPVGSGTVRMGDAVTVLDRA